MIRHQKGRPTMAKKPDPKQQKPKAMAEGGVAEKLKSLLNSHKAGGEVSMDKGGAAFGRYTTGKKYQKAVQRAKETDVNKLPDPRTYAFVSGLLGEAPDELGFSVMHPDYKGIQKAGERGFMGGTILGVAPAVAPLTKGLPVGAAIKPVGGGPLTARQAPQEKALLLARRNAEKLGQSADPETRMLQQGYEPGWYHGSTGDITRFRSDLLGETTGAQSAKKGFFFARDPQNPPESMLKKSSDPAAADVLRKLGIPEDEIARLNTVSMKGHGAETASGYASIGGSRGYKDAMRKANSAEKRGDWSEYEKQMQIAEDLETTRMQYTQGLVAKYGDVRDEMLDAIQNAIYSKKLPQDQAELLDQKVKELMPYGWYNSYSNPQLDGLKKELAGLVGEDSAKNISDKINKFKSVKNERAVAEKTQEGGNVMPVALRYEKPMFYDFEGKPYRDQSYSDLVDQALAAGNDALILKNTYDPGGGPSKLVDVGVVFNPDQIRSKFAAFDPLRKTAATAAASGLAAPDLLAEEQKKASGGEVGIKRGGSTDSIRPTDVKNKGALGVSRALQKAHEFASKPFGYPNPPGELISEILGVPAVSRTLERIGYGEPLTTGKGMTLRPRDDTTEAALAVLPLAPMTKNLPVGAAIKSVGGNWRKGSVDEALKPLKGPYDTKQAREELRELREQVGDLPRYREADRIYNNQDALDQWVDRNLGNYFKNEMATPVDPIRAMIDRRMMEIEGKFEKSQQRARELEARARAELDPRRQANMLRDSQRMMSEAEAQRDIARANAFHISDQEVGMNRYRAPEVRRHLGTEQFAKSPEARAWEDATDVSASSIKIKDLREDLREPWMDKADPETVIWSPIDRAVGANLGFDEIIKTLKNDLDAGRIKPEQLNKISVDQAAKRTAELREQDALAKREQMLKYNENLPVFKEYPEGYRWVELHSENDPELTRFALKREGEIMGHCVGDYCDDVISGERKIYSLRDPSGEPRVTVEVKPREQAAKDRISEDVDYGGRPIYRTSIGEEFASMDEAVKRELAEDIYNADYDKILPEILQIKGSGKKDPAQQLRVKRTGYEEEPDAPLLPFVQDFVKSGNWSGVEDLRNTNLYRVTPGQKLPGFSKNIDPGFYTLDDFKKMAAENEMPQEILDTWMNRLQSRHYPFAKGGEVKMADGGAIGDYYKNLMGMKEGGEVKSDCGCNDEPKMATGGSVADELKKLLSGGEVKMNDGGSPEDKPFIGYRRAGRRPESQQNRKASADIPVAALRGFVSGTLGLPSDILNLPGAIYSGVTGKDSYEIPFGSEDIERRLPLREVSETPAGKAFTTAGQLAGGAYTGPMSGARAALAVPKAIGKASEDFVLAAGQPVVNVYKPHTPLKPDPDVGKRYKVKDIGGLAPRKNLDIEALERSQAKIFPWDATSRNKLVTEVSDVPLTKPVLTEGGDEYMLDLGHIAKRIAGASNRGIAERIMTRINEAALENQLLGSGTGKVYGFPVRMGPGAEMAATFPTNIALDFLKQANLSKKELKELDQSMRNMVFEGKKGAFKNMAPFGSPDFIKQLDEGLKTDKKGGIQGFSDMNMRKAFMNRMAMVENQKRMGYNIQDISGAVLAEELKGIPKGYVGNVAAELEPFGKLRPSASSTYDTDFPGVYAGSMPNMPVEILMPQRFSEIYREMKKEYPDATFEALRNMTIGALEKRNQGISEKIGPRNIDAVKTFQEGLKQGDFDPYDIKQVYDYMRRKKLGLKLAKGGDVGGLSRANKRIK